jgi:predicted aldo/keto reductase-like oxidoreductase
MNSMDMVQENIRIAEQVKAGELTEQNMELYAQVRAAINEKVKIPCTGCGYCQPCPFGVDIPGAFRSYNVSYTDNFFTAEREYFMCTTLRAETTRVTQCKKCGKCEKHCPQGIHIRDELDNVKKRLENPVYRIVASAAKLLSKK